MKKEYEDYLKFIDEALELAKTLPRYFSKFSNKIYCNHQKMVIYVLMQKLKLTTRGIVSWLRSNSDARLHLGMHRVPVHTTIVRFCRRINLNIPKMLNIRTATNVAVDATGFELESKSYYYRTIFNSDRRQRTKRYMKLSLSVDTDKLLILKYKIRKKFRHDTLDFKEVLKNLSLDYVRADKDYDSRENRKFVINKLHAIPIIPVRRHTNFYGYKSIGKKIDGLSYHQRSKVETIFSVIKRKYGSVLRTRSFATQIVELTTKLVVYNLDRKLNYIYWLFSGLHQSLRTKDFYYKYILNLYDNLQGL
jgi:hypothetical protein